MEMLKKYWPFVAKVKEKDVTSLIVALLIFIIGPAVIGFVLGLLSWIPIIGLVFSLIGWLVGVYGLIGIILSILAFIGKL